MPWHRLSMGVACSNWSAPGFSYFWHRFQVSERAPWRRFRGHPWRPSGGSWVCVEVKKGEIKWRRGKVFTGQDSPFGTLLTRSSQRNCFQNMSVLLWPQPNTNNKRSANLDSESLGFLSKKFDMRLAPSYLQFVFIKDAKKVFWNKFIQTWKTNKIHHSLI